MLDSGVAGILLATPCNRQKIQHKTKKGLKI